MTTKEVAADELRVRDVRRLEQVAGAALAVPPLENGDRLTRAEFERRYEAMPHVKKAELIHLDPIAVNEYETNMRSRRPIRYSSRCR